MQDRDGGYHSSLTYIRITTENKHGKVTVSKIELPNQHDDAHGHAGVVNS